MPTLWTTWRLTGRCGAGTWKVNKYLTDLGLDKSPSVCYNKYNEMRER